MSIHNVERNLNLAAKDSLTLSDFGSSGMKSNVIAESTSGSGVTIDSVPLKDAGVILSGAIVRTGGDKTLAITIADADYTVLAENSGKTHLVSNVSANRTFTLPAAAAGLYYKFVSTMEAADGHAWIFDAGSNTNFFLGGLLFIDSNIVGTDSEIILSAGDGNSNSKLTINLPSVSTVIEMYCDGTNWFLSGTVFSITAPAWADQ